MNQSRSSGDVASADGFPIPSDERNICRELRRVVVRAHFEQAVADAVENNLPIILISLRRLKAPAFLKLACDRSAELPLDPAIALFRHAVE